jgi:hypothetical protein
VKCLGTCKNGEPCKTTFGLSPDGLCFTHDPLRAVELAANRKARSEASGKRKQELRASLPPGMPRAPKTLEDAVRWSSWAMHATASGIIDSRTGHEIGYLVNAFKAAVEKRDLLKEIEQLRADLAEARKPNSHVRMA